MGQLGADKTVIRVAMRGETALQPLALASGDKVRLFNRVVVDRRHFASNGDTVTVLDANNDAMRVRRDDGTEATVKYDQLRARRDRPVQLAYGHALTHDAAQGLTSDEHINAMPDGSRAVNSRKAYPAESRQRDTTWLVTNEAAERKQIASRIPIGTFQPIRDADIWRNVANNLGRADMRQSATDFLRHGSGIRRGCHDGAAGRQRPGRNAGTGRQAGTVLSADAGSAPGAAAGMAAPGAGEDAAARWRTCRRSHGNGCARWLGNATRRSRTVSGGRITAKAGTVAWL